MVNQSKKNDQRFWKRWRASGAVKPAPFVLKLHRVVFPLFEIASNPTIPLTLIKERRFNLIDRYREILDPDWRQNEIICRTLKGMLEILDGDVCRM